MWKFSWLIECASGTRSGGESLSAATILLHPTALPSYSQAGPGNLTFSSGVTNSESINSHRSSIRSPSTTSQTVNLNQNVLIGGKPPVITFPVVDQPVTAHLGHECYESERSSKDIKTNILQPSSNPQSVVATTDSNITLWQFLLELLLKGEHTDLIQWTNQQGEFKVPLLLLLNGS